MAIEIFPSSTPPPPTPPLGPPPASPANSHSSTSSGGGGGSLPQTPSRGISPRISFSYDLTQCDVVPVEPHLPLNPSSLFASANFNFYYPRNPPPGGDPHFDSSSSADELFSNGVMLPLHNLNITATRSKKTQQQPATRPAVPITKSKSRKSTTTTTTNHPPAAATSEDDAAADPKTGERNPNPESSSSSSSQQQNNNAASKPPPPPASSSFWKFKRSRSFNCGRIYSGTLCPLPLLSRSKSTGSNSSSKRQLVPKEEHQQQPPHHQSSRNHHKQIRNPNPSTTHHYKPPLKKGYTTTTTTGGGHSSSVSPLLNVPSGNLFGSLFCSVGRGGGTDTRKGSSKKKVGV